MVAVILYPIFLALIGIIALVIGILLPIKASWSWSNTIPSIIFFFIQTGFVLFIEGVIIYLILIPLYGITMQLYFSHRIEWVVNLYNGPEYQVVEANVRDNADLKFHGGISKENVQILQKYLDALEGRQPHVSINSKGGSVEAAKDMVSNLRALKATITIYRNPSENSDCASACVNVFAGFPDNERDPKPNSDVRFMFHQASINFYDSYGLVFDKLFGILDSLIPDFTYNMIEAAPISSEVGTRDLIVQRAAADALEGSGVENGRLRQSIEACPDKPFDTPKGITLTYAQIKSIILATGPILCARRYPGR